MHARYSVLRKSSCSISNVCPTCAWLGRRPSHAQLAWFVCVPSVENRLFFLSIVHANSERGLFPDRHILGVSQPKKKKTPNDILISQVVICFFISLPFWYRYEITDHLWNQNMIWQMRLFFFFFAVLTEILYMRERD